MTPRISEYLPLIMTDAGCVVTANALDIPLLNVTDVDVQEQEQGMTYHDLFRIVLEDLVRVTHCHGCGRKRNVCFFGYVGEFCGKRCYHEYVLYYGEYYDTDDEEYDDEDTERLPHSALPCGWCEEDRPLSRANSNYFHQFYCSLNPSGVYWPMGDYRRACYNKCIRTRPVVRIRGYNHW